MTVITGIITSASVLVGSLQTLGIDVSGVTPVFRFEVAENTRRLDSIDLRDARREWHDIKRDIDSMRRKKEPVPQYLKDRLWELEASIKALEG